MSLKLKKWLTPGIGVKRWLVVAGGGLLCFTVGVLVLADVPAFLYDELRSRVSLHTFLGWVGILLGLFFMLLGWERWAATISRAMAPNQKRKLVDLLYERSQLGQGLKVVAFGGGTGLGSLLRGLKPYSSNLSAVVTVCDDGGSSGRLSKELGVLPPGDIRNCLVALADDESLMSDLFDYRFQDGRGLSGHSFGNLFLAAMTDVAGDFEEAIRMSSQILATRGRVLPSTLSSVRLCARYTDKSVVRGESSIPKAGKKIHRVFLEPRKCEPPPEVLEAIQEADLIILGPGSLYTSVIPNLLVDGIPEALAAAQAPKIYICNVMTQPGETDGYGAADHVRAIIDHAGEDLVDYAVVNREAPSEERLKRYEETGATVVDPQIESFEKMSVKPVMAGLLNEADVVRHDSDRLAAAILDLVARHNGRRGGVQRAHLRAVK